MSDPVQTDALAAEYVLGTLDFDERTQAQALLVIDPEFVAKVRLWERWLGELHLMVEPVEPEGKVWDRIKAKVPAPPPKPASSRKPEISPEPRQEPDIGPGRVASAKSASAKSASTSPRAPAAEAQPAPDAMSAAAPEPPPACDADRRPAFPRRRRCRRQPAKLAAKSDAERDSRSQLAARSGPSPASSRD